MPRTAKAETPITFVLERPAAERLLEAVRGDIRGMVDGGSYTENPARFSRLAEAAESLSDALGTRNA